MNIADAPANNDAPLNLIAEVRTVFERMQASQKCALVYTDGSTSARCTKPNSGASIHVTDEAHGHVWSGGFVVAALVINACPPHFPVKLRMDSKAAIGAITNGPLSERKRV